VGECRASQLLTVTISFCFPNNTNKLEIILAMKMKKDLLKDLENVP